MRYQFQALDGLRGVAALAVVLFHRRQWFGGDAFLGHAYLAVDFFFMLSGFVIAHAYADRLGDWRARRAFFRERVIRLHPLLALGALLGCAVFAFQIGRGDARLPELPALTFLSAFVPWPATWTSGIEAFPINAPAWSLFWELAVNVAFALVATRLTDRRLAAIIAVSALATLYGSATTNGFKGGILQPSLWQGAPRVSLSFFVGVLLLRLFRRGWRVPLPDAAGAAAAILVASFALLPHFSPWSVVYDPLIVLLLYPVLLLWVAAATPLLPRLTALLGAVSYPVYILHLPLLNIVNRARSVVLPGAGEQPGVLDGLVCLAVVVAVAYAALRFYDKPLRDRLKRRFRSARHRAPASVGTDAGKRQISEPSHLATAAYDGV